MIQQSPVASPAPVHTSTPTTEVIITHHSQDEVMAESEEETYGSCLLIIMVVKFCDNLVYLLRKCSWMIMLFVLSSSPWENKMSQMMKTRMTIDISYIISNNYLFAICAF